jgi:type VI secretion system protein ImpL
VLPACREAIANRYPFAMESKVDVPLADFTRIFGTDGVFHGFFKKYLADQVDTTSRTWSMHDGSASLSRAMLDQFAAAQAIRDMFFPGGATKPAVSFSVTISIVDAESTRFILEIDGRNADNKRGRPLQRQMQWPGDPPGAAVATFEGPFIAERAVMESGPWAWLRAVDKNSSGQPDALGRVTLAIHNPFHQAQVVVEASSGRANPFGLPDWRQFSCEAS